MKRLQSLFPDQADFATLQAEELAQRFLANRSSPTKGDVLQTTGLPNVWQIATPSGRALLLFETSRLTERMHEWIASQGLPSEVTVSVSPPTSEISSDSVIASLIVGERLPGWQITLVANDRDFFRSATTRRITAYLWIGILVIATTTVLASLIARAIRKQNQLAKLKNDLVATISHELKTPLASMRLLVDTLLDSPKWDETQAREYLQLMGKENMRLSRLIDNFLAFSRIERNKYRFDFVNTAVNDIIQESIESVQERFQSPDCQFDVRINADLPPVSGDRDALVTVVINLLDNAYKYSGAKKHIVLSAFTDKDQICIEVQDNGVGLSQRDAKRIFKRFYQADRRLSRGNEGCGLGLSIVQYIVDAHGGTVRVISEPGAGSRFIVNLPAVIVRIPSAEDAVA
jgi:signal transduction histidine kinase